MTTPRLRVRSACPEDLESVLSVQRRAFARVARDYGIDPAALPPMGETVCDLLAEFEGGTRFFVAVEETQSIVGAVRARRTADSVHVGRLVVDDDWTRCGVATNLMRALEASFPSEAFELFTGADAEAPLALYLKLGYRVTRRDEEGPVPLVWLEKRPRAAASE